MSDISNETLIKYLDSIAPWLTDMNAPDHDSRGAGAFISLAARRLEELNVLQLNLTQPKTERN